MYDTTFKKSPSSIFEGRQLHAGRLCDEVIALAAVQRLSDAEASTVSMSRLHVHPEVGMAPSSFRRRRRTRGRARGSVGACAVLAKLVSRRLRSTTLWTAITCGYTRRMELPQMTESTRSYFHIFARCHKRAGHPPVDSVEHEPASDWERAAFCEMAELGLMREKSECWVLTAEGRAVVMALVAAPDWRWERPSTH
jgi:hypothetical protein